MAFKAGDKVAWTSQAQGSWTAKSGTVVADVPAGESAMRHIPSGTKKSRSKVDKDKSSIDRVLVAVPAKDGKVIHYYCPRRSVLVAQENEEDSR